MNPNQLTMREWTNPAAENQPNLVRLTADSLTFATVPAADIEKRAALDAAAAKGRVIPLAVVTRLEGSQDGADFTVHFRESDEKTAKAAVTLKDRESRDELLDAVQRRLGPGWERIEGREGVATILLGLLGVLAIGALLTWLAHDEAQSGRRPTTSRRR